MREKKANSRQQSLSPMPRNREVSKSLESQSTSQSHMRARGRPPLSNKGPRSPTSTQRANTELQDQRRRASHISNVRRAAALKRHHPDAIEDTIEDCDKNSQIESKEDDKDIEEGPSRRSLNDSESIKESDAIDDQAEVKSNRTKEKPHGSMPYTTYRRHMIQVKQVFEENTNSWEEKIGMTVSLLARSNNIINERKMNMRIGEIEYKRYLQERKVSETVKQRTRRKVNKVRDEIKNAQNPK